MKYLKPLLVSALLATPALAPHAASDVSKVNGSIHVSAGETTGTVSTVNGSIRLEENVTAQNVETVNGSIHIGRSASVQRVETVNGKIMLLEDVRARSIETVNGGITCHENVRIAGDVTAVNGAIRLERGVDVAGDVSNVSGHIELEGARVGGMLSNTRGDIHIGRGSHVEGGVRVEKAGWSLFSWYRKAPRIVVGPQATVNGTLTFEQEVELYVSEQADIGPVHGATVIRFSGERP